jgi:hypothetical protein
VRENMLEARARDRLPGAHHQRDERFPSASGLWARSVWVLHEHTAQIGADVDQSRFEDLLSPDHEKPCRPSRSPPPSEAPGPLGALAQRTKQTRCSMDGKMGAHICARSIVALMTLALTCLACCPRPSGRKRSARLHRSARNAPEPLG